MFYYITVHLVYDIYTAKDKILIIPNKVFNDRYHIYVNRYENIQIYIRCFMHVIEHI